MMNAIPIPVKLRGRPFDKRGFLVPYFVAWFEEGRVSFERHGEPDHRVVDPLKMYRCVRLHRCWLCGQPLGSWRAFVLGPMCVVTRTTSEPASHYECALYAVRACPFLSRPAMRRNPTPFHTETTDAPGLHVDRNPGVHALWVAKGCEPFKARVGQPGLLFRVFDPVKPPEWWREGRSATRDEVAAALESGTPILRAKAEEEGPAAVRDLDALLILARDFLPREDAS